VSFGLRCSLQLPEHAAREGERLPRAGRLLTIATYQGHDATGRFGVTQIAVQSSAAG
jgi:hypothetical protein